MAYAWIGDYYFDTSTGAIGGYQGATGGSLNIPSQISGVNVTSIAANAFKNKQFSVVSMPNTITSIGAWAFQDSMISSLSLSSNLTIISTMAFWGNIISSITIPASVNAVQSGAFDNCGYLTRVTMLSTGVIIDQTSFGSISNKGDSFYTAYTAGGIGTYDYINETNVWNKTALQAPATPVLSVSRGSNNTFNFSWTASAGAAYYQVYLSGDFITDTTSTSYTTPTLSFNAQFGYKVRAVSSYGLMSPFSNFVVVVTTPSSPSDLVVTATSETEISLQWNHLSTSASFLVYKNGQQTGDTANKTWNVTGLSPNTAYNLSVQAYYNSPSDVPDAGILYSVAADIYNIKTKAGAPTDLSASLFSTTGFTISWTAPAGGADSYKIYRNGSLATTQTGTSYALSGLTANSLSDITVTSTNTSGESVPVALAVYTLPESPTNLVVNGITASTAALLWTQPAGGATSYNIYANGILVGNSVTTSYQATGLLGNTSYEFKVTAVNSSGETSLATAPSASATTLVAVFPSISINNGIIHIIFGSGWFNIATTNVLRVFYKTDYYGDWIGDDLTFDAAGLQPAMSPIDVPPTTTELYLYNALPEAHWFMLQAVQNEGEPISYEFAQNFTPGEGAATLPSGKAPSDVDIVVDQSNHVINLTWNQEE